MKAWAQRNTGRRRIYIWLALALAALLIVGRLFFAGGASEELQPIYLHPAVMIAPRFDAEGQLLGS